MKFRVIRCHTFQDCKPKYYLQSKHRSKDAAIKACKKINALYQKQSIGYSFSVQELIEDKWETVHKVEHNNILNDLFFS